MEAIRRGAPWKEKTASTLDSRLSLLHASRKNRTEKRVLPQVIVTYEDKLHAAEDVFLRGRCRGSYCPPSRIRYSACCNPRRLELRVLSTTENATLLWASCGMMRMVQ